MPCSKKKIITCEECSEKREVSIYMFYAINNKSHSATTRCKECSIKAKTKDRTIICPECGEKRKTDSASVASSYRNGKKKGYCPSCSKKGSYKRGKFEKGCIPWNKGAGTKTKEDERLYKMLWRENNRDAVNQYFIDYYHSNKEKLKLSRRLYSISRRAQGTITVRIFKSLKSLYTECYICGNSFNGDMEIDHIIPISKGGTNDQNNLALACRKCNRMKSDKMLDEFLDDREFLKGTVNALY